MKSLLKSNQKLIFFIMTMVLMLSAFSCEDEKTDDSDPSRLFRPTRLDAKVMKNTAEITWVPVAGATYILEISRDSLSFTVDLQSISLENVASYTFDDLWSTTRYSVRIKAISAISGTASSEFKQLTFVTQEENIFTAVASADIGINQIAIKWDNTKSVDHINVTTGSNVTTVNLSKEEIEAGTKIITGLDGGTDYKFGIYLGERNRGTLSSTTKNVFSAVAAADIAIYAVSLKWDSTKTVDRIIVSSTSVDDVAISLSAPELSTGRKVIGSLDPQTAYTFRIYDGETVVGRVTATTKGIFATVATADIAPEQVTLKWDAASDADRIVAYAGTVERVTLTLTAEDRAAKKAIITGLTSATDFTFRIYLGDKLLGITPVVRTTTLNIFAAVGANDIESRQVTLRWNATREADRIDALVGGSTVQVSVKLSDAEKTSHQATITGLTPSTEYTFRIYLGTYLMGTTPTVKTKN
jgi:hypothetical protein